MKIKPSHPTRKLNKLRRGDRIIVKRDAFEKNSNRYNENGTILTYSHMKDGFIRVKENSDIYFVKRFYITRD